MNKYDTLNWLKKVIDSTTDYSQWVKCLKLIQRFEIMFEDEGLLNSRIIRDYHSRHLKKLTRNN